MLAVEKDINRENLQIVCPITRRAFTGTYKVKEIVGRLINMWRIVLHGEEYYMEKCIIYSDVLVVVTEIMS